MSIRGPIRLAAALCGAVLSIALAVSAVVLLGIGPGAARADGDPASDVLLGQNVFYPYQPPVSAPLTKTLDSLAAAAAAAKFPIKVALIASPVDLGVVPDLFNKPEKYSMFLDQEISFQGPRPLLVVMPAGFGAQGLPPASTAALASLKKPAGGQSNDLAQAAIAAIPKLAAAAGHPLNGAAAAGGSSKGGGSSTTVVLVVLVVAALATAVALILTRRRRAAA